MKHRIKFTDEDLVRLKDGEPPWEINDEWDSDSLNQVVASLAAALLAERRFIRLVGQALYELRGRLTNDP